VPPFAEDLLFHYTSAATAVESILATGQLRLGMFEFTNDPRESSQWHMSASLPEGVDLGTDDFFAMSRAADRLLRRSVKLACFTQDNPPRNDLDEVSGRGFGHSSLWSQYAANHSGVCIGFDRASLLATLADQLESQGTYFSAPVDYVDDPAPPLSVTSFDIGQVDEFGLDALVAARIQQYWRELFFTKDRDWAAEREYRCVIVTPDPVPLFVEIASCVKVIFLADNFPTAQLPAVHHAARRIGDVQVVSIRYVTGRPALLPSLLRDAEFERPHRRSGDVVARTQALIEAEQEV
jgi:hypothetical protein